MKKIPIETNESITLTDALVEKLLSISKKIVSKGVIKEKHIGVYKRRNFELESSDGKETFSVFTRENTELSEDFSVGCIWHTDSKSIILVRYNGDHGEHTNFLTKEKFAGCHIHKYKQGLYELGVKAENHAETTDKYSTLDEALLVFCKDLNIENFSECFPHLIQSKIF